MAQCYTPNTHIPYLTNLNEIVKYGYYPISDLITIKFLCETLVTSITQTHEKILGSTHPDLTKLQPALDALTEFIDDATYGAISLLSTSHYIMIKNRLGQDKLDICILKHYATNTTYPLNINLAAKRELRVILGKELYYGEYEEVPIKSDLEYCVEFHNKPQCTILRLPKNRCIFCENINPSFYDHNKCYEKWYKDNIKGVCVPAHWGMTPPHDSTNFTRSTFHTKKCSRKNKSYSYIDICIDSCPIDRYVCNCRDVERIMFNFEHLYPKN